LTEGKLEPTANPRKSFPLTFNPADKRLKIIRVFPDTAERLTFGGDFA
jgi:hypothetical protein